jgi:hypothetical protein
MSDPESRPALIEGLSMLLAPLTVAAESEDYLRDMASAIGWNLDAIAGFEIGLAVRNLGALAEDVQALTDAAQTPPDNLDDALDLLNHLGRVFTSFHNLGRILTTQGPSHFEEFGRDLLHAMVVSAWQRTAPISLCVCELLTLVDVPGAGPVAPAVFDGTRRVRRAWPLARVHLDRLKPLLQDPVALLNETYFGTDGLITRESAFKAADRLFPRLARLAHELGLTAYYGLIPGSPIAGDAQAQEDFAHVLTLFYIPAEGEECGVTLAFSSVPGLRGLVARPFGSIRADTEIGQWRVALEATEMVGGLLVGENIEVLGDGALRMKLSAERPPEFDAASYLGGKRGSAIELGHVRLEGELALGKDVREFALMLAVDRLQIRLNGSDGDGFLANVLPREGLSTNVDFAVGWSNRNGFHFSGSAGLEATWPLHIRFGPVSLDSLNLGIAMEGDVIRVQASFGVGLNLGPFAVQIDGVGLEALVDFPEDGGNLGVADLDLRFKPPNGLGLGINAPTVVGGGFLRFDPQKGEYSGVLELKIAEKVSVKGFGLLTTKVPGGKGYSLVVIIFVEDFAPIQLGFGFTLTGIGGLLAINRTFDEEALRAGLKNHTLDSVMFPKAPISNAPQIFSNLNKVFPPANGHHLFGPMVQISWGTPTLITAELAVVLEFGARLRLLILAQVVAILPRRENDLVRLQMDAIGVIDFDKGTAELDATLHDSRLLKKYALTGDMAMRLKWESSPNFALAVGGLHPAFNPPPNFPKLERIAINLSAGDTPRLRCEAYFALTSNTVQFGARAELYASAAGFSVHGDIGFDVLIQFDPFFFLADFHAQLQLKRGSTNLFKVRLEGSLSGPRPLHIKGKATFEILWWDVSIRIDKTLVGGEKPPLPEPVDVLPRLKEALASPGNWVSHLPDSQRPMVTLRANAGAATDVLLHPLGTLTVKQGVVPLNLDISRFGQAAPAGARRFTINSVSLGGDSETPQPVNDFFAPAQFIEMSDDEKLSRPSFESMAAGVTIGSDEITFIDKAEDWLEVKAIEFETWILDAETNVARRSDSENPERPDGPKIFYQLSPALLEKQARFGGAANSEIRRTGKAKYRTTTGKYQISKEGWSIVATDDLTVQPTPGIEARKPTNYSEAAQSLRKMKQENPAKAAGLKILRLSEVRAID